MAFEKRYTAKQAAEAVLAKVKETLEKREHIGWGKLHGKLEREGYSKDSADKIAGAIKAKMEKSDNPGKENGKPSDHNSKDADQHAEGKAPKGEIHPKEKEAAPSDEIRSQAAPEKNPAEAKEGNNELAGTTPTQVGPDGKNVPGGDEIKGHLKLAKFIGHMEAKRKMRKGV